MIMTCEDTTDIKVSVAMITYNHEAFIAQAIESVLMQQTTFKVELVIGEDCSTDGTRAIVRNYSERYPEQIRLLLTEHNLGAQANSISVLQACCGKYIAVLEGDDYWNDPLKLQKQVEFMDNHSNCSMSFHRIYRLDQTTGEMKIWRFKYQPSKPFYSLSDIVRGSFYIRTGSIMLRNGLIQNYPRWLYEIPTGDWAIHVLYAQQGKVGFIDQAMSVYRIHKGGISSGASIEVLDRMVISTFDILHRYLGPRYDKLIRINLSNWLLTMSALSADREDLVKAKSYLQKSIIKCPLSLNMRILDRLVMIGRLYAPPVYRAAKRIQSLGSLFLNSLLVRVKQSNVSGKAST